MSAERGEAIVIDIVFNDIDGCMVPRNYDPLRIVLDEAASARHFAYYRAYAGPQIVIATGRGWEDTRGILERAQFFPMQRVIWPETPVLCEHGLDVVIDPIADIHLALIDEVSALHHLRPSVEPIRRTGECLAKELPAISATLHRHFGRPITQPLLLQKRFSLAVRIPSFAGTLEQIEPAPFFAVIREIALPVLDGLLAERMVVFAQSSTAIDIVPPVNKGDGVRYLLGRYGTSPEHTMYIGDSVPDLAGMREVGWAACPANAVAEVQDYVRARGDRGYRSALEFAEAELEILNRLSAPQPHSCG